jgi:hypothetical protein
MMAPDHMHARHGKKIRKPQKVGGNHVFWGFLTAPLHFRFFGSISSALRSGRHHWRATAKYCGNLPPNHLGKSFGDLSKTLF